MYQQHQRRCNAIHRGRLKKAVQPRKEDNFTNNEILARIDAYGWRKGILQSRFKSILPNSDKKVAWDALTADVNAVSLPRRTLDELKKKWQKLASEARSDLAKRKHPGTGDGGSHRKKVHTRV